MKNFTISLYAFHLRHTLSDDPDDVVEDANLLWENLVKVGENSLPFPGLKNLRSKLIYSYQDGKYEHSLEIVRKRFWLIDSQGLDLGSLPTKQGFEIKAELNPFLLNDTYAVDLTISPDPPDISIDVTQLQHFAIKYLLPSHIEASLGQTLWIYGEVEQSKDCCSLAEKLATALVEEFSLKIEKINQGELFGSQIFQYQITDSSEPDNPIKQCQIFIVINNNNSKTLELFGKAYDCLLNLICSFHKIHYIYSQARDRYREAKRIYNYLGNTIQKFNNLIVQTPTTATDELEEILADIPQKSLDYSRCLQDLQIHLTALRTNIKNYNICLDNIAVLTREGTPQFWLNFLNKDCQKYAEQIQTYLDYLTPRQELFQQVIDTIRGIVETQLTKQTRSLELTVQIIGIAFGGGAIVSGVVTQHIDKPFAPINFKSPFHPLVLSLFWSILATIAFGLLAWVVTKFQHYKNK